MGRFKFYLFIIEYFIVNSNFDFYLMHNKLKTTNCLSWYNQKRSVIPLVKKSKKYAIKMTFMGLQKFEFNEISLLNQRLPPDLYLRSCIKEIVYCRNLEDLILKNDYREFTLCQFNEPESVYNIESDILNIL